MIAPQKGVFCCMMFMFCVIIGNVGQYDDYEDKFGQVPSIDETEFEILKENLPKLIKALSPILIADAIYTQNTFDENYSLYYTYTLVNNAENLVIGHIPESIMPILKSLIPKPDEEIEEDIKAPNSGSAIKTEQSAMTNNRMDIAVLLMTIVALTARYLIRKKSHC